MHNEVQQYEPIIPPGLQPHRQRETGLTLGLQTAVMTTLPPDSKDLLSLIYLPINVSVYLVPDTVNQGGGVPLVEL